VVDADDLVAELAAQRTSAAPRIVERMCPTCIGLAMLGELKSMTIVLPAPSLELP
jgi:hypothetical protein